MCYYIQGPFDRVSQPQTYAEYVIRDINYCAQSLNK